MSTKRQQLTSASIQQEKFQSRMIAAIVARWEFEGLSIGIRRKDTPTMIPNSIIAHVPAVKGPCTRSDELHEGSMRVEYDAIISHILMP
jgi:hypothetical protein